MSATASNKRGALALVLFLFAGVAAAAPSGEPGRAEEPRAQRVITLAPHLAELVYAAGGGDRLVGVSSYSDYPPQVAALPVVADNGRIDIERVLRLKPDLVLAWRSGMQSEQWRELEERGIKVLVSEAEELHEVARLLRAFGRSFGDFKQAEMAALKYEGEIWALRERYGYRSRVRTFVEIWPEPLMTVNDRHIIAKVVRLCGGENVYGGLTALTPSISKEQLIATQPDLILSTVSGTDAKLRWQRFAQLKAVKTGQVHSINASLLTRMGPRLPEAAMQVCTRIDALR